jgi:hypothetical protein
MSAKKKYDPTGYQIMVNGREKEVAACTRKELMQEVCSDIEFFERIDSMAQDLGRLIQAWRKGKPIPEIAGMEGDTNESQ